MSRNSRGGRKNAKPADTLERLRLTTDARLAKFNLWRIALIGTFSMGALALCIPLARILAGQQTGLDVNVSLTFSAAVTLAGGTAAGVAVRYRKRALQAEERVRTLENDLILEKKSAKLLEERTEQLKVDNEGLRGDLEALRSGHGR